MTSGNLSEAGALWPPSRVGWGGRQEGAQEGRDICTPMADSYWGIAKIITALSSSVTQSCPALGPHVLQHATPPCPSPTSRVYSNSCVLPQLCHQPSHPLPSPSPAFNLSQHQGLFKWVGSSPQVAKILEFQLQHQSFQWIFRTDFL